MRGQSVRRGGGGGEGEISAPPAARAPAKKSYQTNQSIIWRQQCNATQYILLIKVGKLPRIRLCVLAKVLVSRRLGVLPRLLLTHDALLAHQTTQREVRRIRKLTRAIRLANEFAG